MSFKQRIDRQLYVIIATPKRINNIEKLGTLRNLLRYIYIYYVHIVHRDFTKFYPIEHHIVAVYTFM